MKIRQAKISDVKQLTKLSAVLGYAHSEIEIRSNLTAVLADKKNIFLVAEENDAVRGYVEGASYRSLLVPKCIRVMGIAVFPEFQDAGIGGRLLSALEDEARKQNYQLVSLTSGEMRHLAHDFYRKHGYVEDHKQLKFAKVL